jgi:hypothetical protein
MNCKKPPFKKRTLVPEALTTERVSTHRQSNLSTHRSKADEPGFTNQRISTRLRTADEKLKLKKKNKKRQKSSKSKDRKSC